MGALTVALMSLRYWGHVRDCFSFRPPRPLQMNGNTFSSTPDWTVGIWDNFTSFIRAGFCDTQLFSELIATDKWILWHPCSSITVWRNRDNSFEPKADAIAQHPIQRRMLAKARIESQIYLLLFHLCLQYEEHHDSNTQKWECASNRFSKDAHQSLGALPHTMIWSQDCCDRTTRFKKVWLFKRRARYQCY